MPPLLLSQTHAIFDMWNDLKTLQPAPPSLSFFKSFFFATSSLEISISTLGALWDCGLKASATQSLHLVSSALFSSSTTPPNGFHQPSDFRPNQQINQPFNQRPSCRPSFRPSNQLQFRCKASLALNQPPITTNLRTLQAPGSFPFFEQNWKLNGVGLGKIPRSDNWVSSRNPLNYEAE